MESKDISVTFEDRQNAVFVNGVICQKILNYFLVEHENPQVQNILKKLAMIELKLLLIEFASLDPKELAEIEVMGVHPFRNINPKHILRYSDQVWNESMVDESIEDVAVDCPCAVALFGDNLWMKWTIPDPEFINECTSPDKLIYTAMVVMEELFHISQFVSKNTRRLLSVQSDFEVYDISRLSESDLEDSVTIRESDVTIFMDYVIPRKVCGELQWFRDREKVNKGDIHYILTLAEIVNTALAIAERYGYPEEFIGEVLKEVQYYSVRESDLMDGLVNDSVFLENKLKYSLEV